MARRQQIDARTEPQRKLVELPGYLADEASADFHRLINERIRLGIMSALAVNRFLTFSDLRDLLHASDGNLSVHARKLEDAGYISCTKGFSGRVPQTQYRLTAGGRAAFERYLNHMESLLHTMRGDLRK